MAKRPGREDDGRERTKTGWRAEDAETGTRASRHRGRIWVPSRVPGTSQAVDDQTEEWGARFQGFRTKPFRVSR